MSEELDLLKELKDRTVRLESRMVQLGDHVGANLRIRQTIEVKMDSQGEPWVEIDAIDASLSRIVTTLREKGVWRGDVPVVLNGQRVAVIYLARVTN